MVLKKNVSQNRINFVGSSIFSEKPDYIPNDVELLPIENLNIDRTDHARIDSMLDKMQAMEESLAEAVLHKTDASGRQPKSVCSDCGSKFGLWYDVKGEYVGPQTHFSTYKTTPCEVCGKVKPCTGAQDYGNLRLGWKREVD